MPPDPTPHRAPTLGTPAPHPPDWTLSPYTGWTRRTWSTIAERIVTAARRHASPNHALIDFPGGPGGYGADVDRLEGFARSFLAAGFLAAGDPAHRAGLDWWAEGLRHGPDPTAPERTAWVRPSEHDQAKVEACSLALILHLTRKHLWNELDATTQELLIDYLAEWVHASRPANNWVWFRLITEQFLKSVGGPWSLDDQEEDLAFSDSCHVGDGWYRDGAGRTFDHYSGWVFQVYPLLWCDMMPNDPASLTWRPIFQARLDRYLADAIHLMGADGGILAQGRSLIYRFAAAAPLWMGAWSGSTTLTPGLVRRAASGMLRHFVDHGAPDENGALPVGWYGAWPKLAQSYSGPGSPYWACCGLLGLALPETHPVWTAVEQPLPVDGGQYHDGGLPSEARDTAEFVRTSDGDQPNGFVRIIKAPGWVVSGTPADGIVRVINHGTDHDESGSDRGDSPLYANIGYSTATFPLLDDDAWVTPLAQSVCLIDQAGRASHRAGFTALGTGVIVDPTPVGWAASHVRAHWIDPDQEQVHHGGGYVGRSSFAGTMTVASYVRGPWEIRAVQLDDIDPQATGLRVGGWATPISDPPEGQTASRSGSGATPLGPSTVPYLDLPLVIDQWMAVLISLTRPATHRTASGPRATIDPAQAPTAQTAITPATAVVALAPAARPALRVTWPDQVTTTCPLPDGPIPSTIDSQEITTQRRTL